MPDLNIRFDSAPIDYELNVATVESANTLP